MSNRISHAEEPQPIEPGSLPATRNHSKVKRIEPSQKQLGCEELPASKTGLTTTSNRPQPTDCNDLVHLSQTTLKDWHPEDQPRERLMMHGPEALSNSELIAILLRSGTKTATALDVARNLLIGADGRLRELGGRTWRELASVHGIGQVKAVTLVAALELGQRRSQESDVDRPLVQSPQAAYQIIGARLADLRHEECWVLWLNTARRLLASERLSSGGVDGTVVDVRKLMAMGLRINASALVLVHNHPSGQLSPSESDIRLTHKVRAAGELLNIPLEDHLIIAGRKFYSFHDMNMLRA